MTGIPPAARDSIRQRSPSLGQHPFRDTVPVIPPQVTTSLRGHRPSRGTCPGQHPYIDCIPQDSTREMPPVRGGHCTQGQPRGVPPSPATPQGCRAPLLPLPCPGAVAQKPAEENAFARCSFSSPGSSSAGHGDPRRWQWDMEGWQVGTARGAKPCRSVP